MDKRKQQQLEKQGFKVGSAAEFLGLSAEESTYLDLRMRLSEAVRNLRLARQLTQAQLARLLSSSQSRVAKVEAADFSVSLDLLVRSLLVMGATHRDLARFIEGAEQEKATA